MATVDTKVVFNNGDHAFQFALDSPAMSNLVKSVAQGIAANVGLAHVKMAYTKNFQYGNRPMAYVITHAKTQKQADHFRRVMEGQVH